MTPIYDCKCPTYRIPEGMTAIYRYEFEDGSQYVGATSTEYLCARHNKHLVGKPPYNCNMDPVIQSGTRWRLEVLELIPDSESDERERYWIAYYRPSLNRQTGGKHGFTYSQTEEHRRKIGQANRGHKVNEEWLKSTYRPILQYTTEGVLVASYKCGADATRQTGVNRGHITECCLGKRRTAGGFIWRYARHPA